jgi:uncharacterized protein (TIGR00299 family) protein
VIGYLDCSSGVSGDKFLGALLDTGADGAFTAADLQTLVTRLAPEAGVRVERVTSHGLAAVSVRVEAVEPPTHRHLADIRALISGAGLPDRVATQALAAFESLAEAEAAAHGTSVERVHFHEVGALDSIADIVGVCAGLEALGVSWLGASTVATGSGTVEGSHGVMPVPTPATSALLLGIPVTSGPASGELTTPTGAALVRTCVDGFGPSPAMTPRAVGYGAGTRDIGVPNICRLTLGEPPARIELAEEDVTVLETNLDHLSPEAAAFAAERLLAEGALDVWQGPIVMKKGRSAMALGVLTTREAAEPTAQRIVALTGTLGVRRTDLPRLVAERESLTVETAYGPARAKRGAGRIRPEHDDVARIASQTGRTYADVSAEIERLAEEIEDSRD